MRFERVSLLLRGYEYKFVLRNGIDILSFFLVRHHYSENNNYANSDRKISKIKNVIVESEFLSANQWYP